jgi:hypothetical protein
MKKIVALKERNFADKDKYDYAPIDFEDAMDSYDKILEIVGEISGDIIAPNAESVDQQGPSIVNNEVIYADGTKENLDAIFIPLYFGTAVYSIFGSLTAYFLVNLLWKSSVDKERKSKKRQKDST